MNNDDLVAQCLRLRYLLGMCYHTLELVGFPSEYVKQDIKQAEDLRTEIRKELY